MNEGAPISLFESVILGIVQGATEFLPISSSGHLVILQTFLGMGEAQMLFDVMLHVGTLIAIFVVFRNEIGELARIPVKLVTGGKQRNRDSERMLIGILLGCIPTFLIGMSLSTIIEQMFTSIIAAGTGLIVTGFILMSTTWKKDFQASANSHRPACVRFAHALLIGTAQGLALFPGISRSGTTIAAALLLGVERELAARFSFLLAIPAILGALVFQLKDYGAPVAPTVGSYPPGTPSVIVMIAGTCAAAITGMIALKCLLGIVRRGRISVFAYYCWAVGLLIIMTGIITA